MPTSRSIRRLRHFVTGNPRLYRLAKIIRFSLTLGPWRPLVIRSLQRLQHNPPLPKLSEPTLFPSLDIESAVSSLNRLGWAPGLTLPPQYVDDILKYVADSPEAVLHDTHEKSEALRRIVFDPHVLSVVRRYIGTEPLFVGTALWRSGIAPSIDSDYGGRTYAQKFHFDVADFRSVTLFIYLTDVETADAGAHVLIEGTHQIKSMWEIVTPWLTDTLAQAKYGDRIKVVTGPRGTGFFEEQTIIHKQALPQEPRVALLITYSLRRRGAWR